MADDQLSTGPKPTDSTQQTGFSQGPGDAESTDEVLSMNTTTPPPVDKSADSAIKSTQVPEKYGGKKIIATIFGVLLLIGGVATGVYLVQRQQQISERAASGKECAHSPDCVLLDNPGNSGSQSFGRDINYIDITAKDYHRYNPGETNDGCYHVIIHNHNLQWNRVGDGPNCKDISNIQVWMGGEKPPEINWNIEQTCDGIKVGVSGDHEGFMAKVEFSPSGSPGTWQNMQSWQINSGPANSHSFNYSPVPNTGWWLRAAVMYKGNQVAVVEQPLKNCSKPEDKLPICHSGNGKNWIIISPDDNGYNGHFESPGKLHEWDFFINDENPDCPPSTPPPTPATASCSDIRIYDDNWNLLSSSDLESLTPGETIRLAVSGTTNIGFFDKARFIVNGQTLPETSNTKPGTDEFYSEYSIPGDVDNFTIDAELHHSSLGWF